MKLSSAQRDVLLMAAKGPFRPARITHRSVRILLYRGMLERFTFPNDCMLAVKLTNRGREALGLEPIPTAERTPPTLRVVRGGRA